MWNIYIAILEEMEGMEQQGDKPVQLSNQFDTPFEIDNDMDWFEERIVLLTKSSIEAVVVRKETF